MSWEMLCNKTQPYFALFLFVTPHSFMCLFLILYNLNKAVSDLRQSFCQPKFSLVSSTHGNSFSVGKNFSLSVSVATMTTAFCEALQNPPIRFRNLIRINEFEFVGASSSWDSSRTVVEDLMPLTNPFSGPNSVLVSHDASYHEDGCLKRILQKHGVRLLFLPPHFPDLNPIELNFNTVKLYIRRDYRAVRARPIYTLNSNG